MRTPSRSPGRVPRAGADGLAQLVLVAVVGVLDRALEVAAVEVVGPAAELVERHPELPVGRGRRRGVGRASSTKLSWSDTTCAARCSSRSARSRCARAGRRGSACRRRRSSGGRGVRGARWRRPRGPSAAGDGQQGAAVPRQRRATRAVADGRSATRWSVRPSPRRPRRRGPRPVDQADGRPGRRGCCGRAATRSPRVERRVVLVGRHRVHPAET